MSCQVKGCRFSTSHSTHVHICGTCHELGHGQGECKNKELRRELENKPIYVVSNPCTIKECQDKQSHTTQAHAFCPFTFLKMNEITSIYAGMGCQMFYKRNQMGRIESIFMHSDDWGQYGNTTQLDLYNEFSKNCVESTGTQERF